jgi:hypothetical protein
LHAAPATLGPRLWSIVQEAGLHPQGMIGVQLHFGPGDPVGVATAVENLRLAVPLIVSTGARPGAERGEPRGSLRYSVVNPGVHSVPAGPGHPDFGAGGTSVTEVLFLGPAALAAASWLSGIVLYRIKVFPIMKLSPLSSN